ncbi:hypothetical protein ACH5RR_036797 [Cinchona calisaya]|uniref:Helicase-like transcription factor CHR28 n=1 Tax=Cinchona calisaya TaxID=153742 RepID=A0ABD2Y4A6_9GENT
MSDHVDPQGFRVDSAKKALFGGLFSIWVVGSLFGHSSNWFPGRGNHKPAGIAEMDSVDICSSDDSDFRAIDEYVYESPSRDSVTSFDSRILTPWALPSSINMAVNDGPSRTASNTARDENSEYLTDDDDEWPSSKRAKNTLPTSFQTSLPTSRSNNLVEDMSSSQVRECHSDRPNSINRYHFGRGTHDDVGEERPGGSDERIIFQAAVKDIHQPTRETTLPQGILSVSLLRHQRIALAWMMEKETVGVNCLGGILADDQGLGKTISMIALIQAQRSLQENTTAENVSAIIPEALNLDDEDQNVDSASEKPKPKGESDDLEEISEMSGSRTQFRNKRPAAGTLVICPASVLRQWARELDEKVTKKAKLSVLVYHGSNRTRDPTKLAKYDVVLTTYAIVLNEVPKQPLVDEYDNDQNYGERYGLFSEFSIYKKQKTTGNKKGKKGKSGIHSDASDCGTLASVRWFRVVLDEAQTIKNHRTQVARACCTLRAKRRWCLSGTPIQNAIDELFSYFRFLKYQPYSNYKAFVDGIKLPISRDSVRGYAKLQVVLKHIMLRRTKGTLLDGKPIITLPPKTTRLTKVDFSAEERAFYNKLEADYRKQFKAYAAAGTVNQNYANLMLMLLRLRQACNHPLLVKGVSSDSVGRESSENVKRLPRQKLQYLLGQLETSLAICGACNDPPENAVVTVCGHVFCFQCVSDYLTGEDTKCPEPGCKQQLSADVIFPKAALEKCLSSEFSTDRSRPSGNDEKSTVLKDKYSSKIKAALEILQSSCKPTPSPEINELVQWYDGASSSGSGCAGSQISRPTKAIVFSQWTSMLDLFEVSLKNTGIKYRRLDGTMSLAARDKAVKEFNANPKVTVILMSLKAGNLGLNMMAACQVILLDLWWNPTTEDQAVDRAHRIGQTRPVSVSRLTIRNTVEDRILALQEQKRKMVASAFGEDKSGGSATRITVEDLKFLFEGQP